MENDISEFGTAAATEVPHNYLKTEESKDAIVEGKSPAFSNQWALAGDNMYIACGSTIRTLNPGLYTVVNSSKGIVYTKKTINIDEIIKFEDGLTEEILTEIEKFWTLKQKFVDYGFFHRRGYLLWGPQGSGKSMLVQQIIQGIIQRKGLAILADGAGPCTISGALDEIRIIEPARHIVCIFEDIDAYIDSYGENNLLALLDGENQINDVLNIATTNYPEKLNKRIVSRPRRFDRIIKIDMPSKSIRQKYLQVKLHASDTRVEEWADATHGFSFAALAELIISVECLGNTFEDTLKILKSIMKSKKSSSDFDEKLGFGE